MTVLEHPVLIYLVKNTNVRRIGEMLLIHRGYLGWDFVGSIDQSDPIRVSPTKPIGRWILPIGDFVKPNERVQSNWYPILD